MMESCDRVNNEIVQTFHGNHEEDDSKYINQPYYQLIVDKLSWNKRKR